MKLRIRILNLLSIALGFAMACATPADALESCKAKIAKDGAIQVSAKDVSGVLEWGNALGQEVNAFANAGTCLEGSGASKCELGAPGSAQRITPPELCTLFLADGGGGTCSAFLKGCTPGLRTIGSGFVAKSGDVMSGTLRALTLDTAFGVPGCGLGDVCAFSRVLSQGDVVVGSTLELDGGVRQPATSGGVVKAGLVVDCDNSPTITRFFNTTGTGAFTVTGGGALAPGECVITTPFSIANRFFSATGIDDSSVGTVDTVVTLDIVSSTSIRVRRSSETLGILNGANGPVSILIY